MRTYAEAYRYFLGRVLQEFTRKNIAFTTYTLQATASRFARGHMKR